MEERLLQANNSTSTLTQTDIIKHTCEVYVSIFAGLFIVFLALRSRFVRAYNIKKSYPALHVPVADDSFGFFSWTWNVFGVDYEDIVEQCGMDAATTICIFELGVKLSLVGVFNSFFLFPVYSTLGTLFTSDKGPHGGPADPVQRVSLSNLEQGHSAAVAAAVAAYVFFGSAMHFIDKDFEWFTHHRHNFLKKRRAQNYSVYMSGLPPEMRTDTAIRGYFNNCFSHDAVADARVALVIPSLEKKVARRANLLAKLEHLLNVERVKGKTPTHRDRFCTKVESVPWCRNQIEDLNEEIDREIDRVEELRRVREADSEAPREAESGESESERPAAWGALSAVEDSLVLVESLGRSVGDGVRALVGGEDGAPRNACFVSFRDLMSANLARQAVHNPEPWFCVPQEPPLPDMVNWKNVGKSNTSKQIGELISFLLTVVLCIFWTIPVGFVASLSNVEELEKLLPFLQAPLDTYPWLSRALAVLAPFILVVFISLLPYIVLLFIMLEGLIEVETLQHPSLFAKLSRFTIIQTFFISTISSAITSKLQEILERPSLAIELMATALPAQSAYFIQIIIVQNLLPLGLELLRVTPIVTNIARKISSKMLGHNLTEKERNETFMGLRSLDDPVEYYFGRELGQKTILVFMVLFVYGCMAPITSYFTLVVFGLLAVGFRHQFIYVYPPANDSGGKMWLNFTKLTVTCMIIAEIVLAAVLSLKESVAGPVLMVPLIVGTIIFDVYFKRRHYSITSFLPLGDCAIVDSENKRKGATDEWLKDVYLQPALKRGGDPDTRGKELLSLNTSLNREIDAPDDESGSANRHKERGNALMSGGDYQLALQEYTRAIDLSPSGPNSHVYYSNRAASHIHLQDYDAAAADCRVSIELNPDYDKAHTRLGLSLYFQGDYRGAVDSYKKALELNPKDRSCSDYLAKATEKLAAQEREGTETGQAVPLLGRSETFDPSIDDFD